MHDELLDIAIKKSPMWEINNPRVNALDKSNDGYCLPVERNETRSQRRSL